MNLFEKLYFSISVHVASVYALQTCCDVVLEILPHILMHNITTHYKLMVYMLHV